MTNFRLTIAYDGTRYSGWQRQGNTDKTIQGKLEALLTRLDDGPVVVHGSGRTDAGVHAAGQVANCQLRQDWDPDQLMQAINDYLPEDIRILSVEPVPMRFHSRLNTKRKTYLYRLWLGDKPDVFVRRYVTPEPAALCLDAMQEAARALTGRHDFFAFCLNRRYRKSTERTIYDLTLAQHGPELHIKVCGSGFLYGMVRLMVGTLVEVGKGERSADSIPELLRSRDREQAGRLMPAQGLTLLRVDYDKEDELCQ